MKSSPLDQACNLNIAPDILAGSPVHLVARGTNILRWKSTHDPAINPRAFLRASFSSETPLSAVAREPPERFRRLWVLLDSLFINSILSYFAGNLPFPSAPRYPAIVSHKL